MSPEALISYAWEIAKWQAIYDYMEEKVIPYLEEGESGFEEFLTLEVDNPIAAIYDFELDYDEAMWATWDNLDDVVREMFRTIKKHN